MPKPQKQQHVKISIKTVPVPKNIAKGIAAGVRGTESTKKLVRGK